MLQNQIAKLQTFQMKFLILAIFKHSNFFPHSVALIFDLQKMNLPTKEGLKWSLSLYNVYQIHTIWTVSTHLPINP